MSRSERLFRYLLRLFPAEFRGDFGDEMTQTFREHRQDVLARGGTMALLALWRDTIRGIVATAPREHLDVLRQDVRYGLRNLRRSPGFTAVAIVALAIGIGANTAVFSIVDGVLFKALPYPHPERLVTAFESLGTSLEKMGFSPPDFETVRRDATSFTDVAAYRNVSYELSGIGQSIRVKAAKVSPSLFSVLGASPALGRTLAQEDDTANAAVAILSFGTWAGVFGRDPNVIGRTVSLDRRPYTIVGVMPEPFTFPPRGSTMNGEPAALFVPMAFTPFERQAFGMMYNNSVVGRLKPGVTLEAARSEIELLTRRVIERYPPPLRPFSQGLQIPLGQLDEEIVGRSRSLLLLLMGAVAIVLLIACADVANLMLTRAGGRQRELAIRSAMGASPTRVVRQLLTESFVLAALGAALGLLLGYGTLRVFQSLAGTTLPRAESIGFDWRVVLFTAIVGLSTPLLFGLLPALRTAFASALYALKEGSYSTAGVGRQRVLRSLVVAQFALALMLSVAAGLFVRSFLRVLATDPGFRVDHVVNTMTALPTGRYSNGQIVKAFYAQAVEAAQQIPGVALAGASTDRPLDIRERRACTPDHSARPVTSPSRLVAATWTVGRYFEALGIPLKRGRLFTDTDGKSGQPVVIISETLARDIWADADPIGRQIKWGIEVSQAPWMTVVGVVGDIKQGPLDAETLPLVYEPLAQEVADEMQGVILPFYANVNLVTRTASSVEVTTSAIRASLQRADPALPVAKTDELAEIVNDSVRSRRFSTSVVAAFAVVALGLAAMGIYGVLASVVLEQTREIGLRLALGATSGDVLWLVFRRALVMAAAGVSIGIAGALAITQVMAGLLYQIRPTDAVTFLGAALLLAGLAAAASLIPAWRATRVDPLVALRAG
jgi:putative ABC transport system permease protein